MTIISRVSKGDAPRAAKQNEIIDVCNAVLGANAASGVTISQQGGALNLSKRPLFRSGALLAEEMFCINNDRTEEFIDIGEIVSLVSLTNTINLSDTKASLSFSVSTYFETAGEGEDETPKLFAVMTQATSFETQGRICVNGLCYARVTYGSGLSPGDLVTGLRVEDDNRIGVLIESGGDIQVLGVSEEPIEEGGDEYWALVNLGGGGGSEEGQYEDPVDQTYSAEHSEAAITGNNYTTDVPDGSGGTESKSVIWYRDDPPTDTLGLKLTIQAGEAYYDAGDEKLYAYYVDIHFDSLGALLFVEAERRQVVDTPGSC